MTCRETNAELQAEIDRLRAQLDRFEITSRVALGVVTAESVVYACAQAIGAVITERAVRWAWYQPVGPYLDMGRNELVQVFNQPQFRDCDRLLMVDSDIGFTPGDVRQLEADDLPVVSGVYHSQFEEGVLPVAYRWQKGADGQDGMLKIADWLVGRAGQGNPVEQVDGVGAGFLMLHRSVLDALAAVYEPPCQWFAEDVRDGSHYGEDLTLCLRLRDLGIPIYVDRRVQVAHYKHMRIGGPVTPAAPEDTTHSVFSPIRVVSSVEIPAHLGGFVPGGDHLTRCEVLWRWLATGGGNVAVPGQALTVLDIGCGDGVAMGFFESLGAQAWGVDGVPQSHPRIITHDYTTGPYDPRITVDLGWCCEFVEHVAAEHVENFLVTFRRCNTLLLSHAFPGQDGHHHVNCQDADYWIRLLEPDFTFDEPLTELTRSLAGDPPNHYARSGLAFRRKRI